MSTVRNATQCVKGLGGSLVSAMGTEVKSPFANKAEDLGRQIAADNGVDFETGEVPDDTLLSPAAQVLLDELTAIRNNLLIPRLRQ